MKKEPQVKTRTTSQNKNMKAIVVAPLLLVAAIAVILVPSASAMSKCQKCYLTTPATLCNRFVCGRRLFTRNRAQLIGDFENGEDAQLIGDFEDDEDVGFGGVTCMRYCGNGRSGCSCDRRRTLHVSLPKPITWRRLGKKKKLKKAKKRYDNLICCEDTFRKVPCRQCGPYRL